MSSMIRSPDEIGESLPSARISPDTAGATAILPTLNRHNSNRFQSKPKILLPVLIVSERRRDTNIPALVLIVIIL